jgi:hypothetical protein
MNTKLLEYINDYNQNIKLDISYNRASHFKDFISVIEPLINEHLQNNIVGKFIKFNDVVMYVERHNIDINVFNDKITILLYGISYEFQKEPIELDLVYDEKLSDNQFYSSYSLDVKVEELNNIVLIDKPKFIEESKDRFESYLKCLLETIK